VPVAKPLTVQPALDRPDLLAPTVAAAVADLPHPESVQVAEIDPDLADTVAFCAEYGVPPGESGNCVVVAGRRDGQDRFAACVVLATTRADVNGAVRRHLDVRKLSFARLDDAVSMTGMEYGGITVLGLPPGWPILLDAEVVRCERLVVGSGIRRSKLVLPGAVLVALPGAVVLDDLGLPPVTTAGVEQPGPDG
jgi:prolyl-tRNA editing enzyme YbaK/EbsC (Cys-tRNA(Pro) deacylase)